MRPKKEGIKRKRVKLQQIFIAPEAYWSLPCRFEVMTESVGGLLWLASDRIGGFSVRSSAAS